MSTLVATVLSVASVTYPDADHAVIHLDGFTFPEDAVSPSYSEDYPYTVQPEGDFHGFQYGFTYTSPTRFGDPSIELWRAGAFYVNFANTPSHVGDDWSDLGYWHFGGFDPVADELKTGAEIHIDATDVETLFPASNFTFTVYWYAADAEICYTTLIPYGSPDDLMFPPGLNSTAMFQGPAISNGQDFAALVAANTTVVTDALSTDDETSYNTMDSPGYRAAAHAAFDGGPHELPDYSGMAFKGRQDTAVPIPAGFTVRSASVVFEGRTSGTDEVWGAQWLGYHADSSPGSPVVSWNATGLITAAAPGDWVRGEVALDPSGLFYEPDIRAALIDRLSTIVIGTFGTAVDELAFLALSVTYCGSGAPAFVRPRREVFPRDDDRGQVFPRSTSRQSSNTTTGYY